MFVRFRQTAHRLQASLIETRRIDGKVRHEHIASLGSIATPPSTTHRIAFWSRLHERLARLANRIGGDAQAKILGSIHARVPMVTADEQRALQLENAKADSEFWLGSHDMHAGTAADHKALAVVTEQAIKAAEALAAEAKTHADAARDRVARIERGESVEGGLGKPKTREDREREMLEAGFTRAQIRFFKDVSKISEAGYFEWLHAEIMTSKERAERRTVRDMVRLIEGFDSLSQESQERVIAQMEGRHRK
jgi:hypothetical protein